MRRSEFDHVPNRIIPPHISDIDNRRPEYDRSSRILAAPSVRQPLLGNAPMVESYRQGYAQSITYNGPVMDSLRRSGFDKGPYGEDLAMGRHEGRQPIRNPKLAVEHIGGDMDISRSRSASPEIQIIKVTARSVRDDRKRERNLKRSRSRSRDRDRTRTRPRDRDMGRERAGDRETLLPVPHDQIRDGIVWTNDNYYEFLIFYVDLLYEKIQSTTDMAGQRKLKEEITPASEAEKDRIVLPPDFDRSDRERMLHCDTTIIGLPASIFFGSGYGPRAHYAKYSAAKDFVDKCHRIGVINSELHAAIGDWQRLDRNFKSQFSVQISKAVNAVILLIKRMTTENLPIGFMTMRQLPIDLIDRFKTMLRMVMIDVYYQGIETPSTVVPKTLETVHDSYSQRPRDSDMRRYDEVKRPPKEVVKGPSAEELIRQREKELKEQMELELEKKRAEMEQEIRQKVLEEERAKIRAELEMEKKLEIMKMQQHQYQMEKEQKEAEEQKRQAAMLKQVEDDFNAMVQQLEERFVEIRSKGLNHILEMIYSSATFETIQLYSTTLTSISYEQKQQLVKDLKSLLDRITISINLAMAQQPPKIQMLPTIGAYPNSSMSASAPMSQYQMYQQQQQPPKPLMPPTTASPSTSTNVRSDEVRRLTLGNMKLRSLTPAEQRRLTKGNKVIAQDAKTGNWSLATFVKIREDRVTLTVGNATWKKYLDELYKEDDNRY